MNLSLERELIHNPVLGATALWSFCSEYVSTSEQDDRPSLPVVMLVLPIVLHRRSMLTIRRMKKKSGLLKAVTEHPELTVGLQERLELFADLTLTSLLLACSTPLLTRERDREWPAYSLGRKTLPEEIRPVADDMTGMVSASRRLGAWYAPIEAPVICHLLQVNF
jgi:hypothetical protein